MKKKNNSNNHDNKNNNNLTLPFHEKGGEARSGATAERVEDEETLESSALIGQFADAVQNQVNDLLANGVVTASVVVSSILLACGETRRKT